MAQLLFRKFIYTILEKLIPTENVITIEIKNRTSEATKRQQKVLCFQFFNSTEGCQFLAGKIRGYYNVVIIDIDFNNFIEKQDAQV